MNYPRRIFREFNDEKLEQIRNHPYYKEVREKLIALADDYLVNDPPRIRFSKIHLYATTGNRNQYEKDYFHYLNRLSHLFQAYIITEDEKYLPELSDTIWNICNFESWALPAHVKETQPIDKRRSFIALFSARMGMTLSEVLYFIGDKLPELVVRRAKAELQYRIIDSFAERDHGFCNVKHNWSAVCVAAVLCTYLYIATDEEIEAQLPRMMKVADNYMDGYEDDCCCSEGISYWKFGFSNLLVFASMLKDYTDGKINYFDNPKLKKIAMFPYRVTLDEAGNCLTFADSSTAIAKMPGWMGHILKDNYPDFPIMENQPLTEPSALIRTLFWTNPDYVGEKIKIADATFENVQQFTYHGNSYAVGAKAGHNKEFHNHNDVGSFIVSKNNEVTFFDLGAGAYTKQYFAPDTRYLDPVCSSRGHSVPIINGEEQPFGNDRGACELHAIGNGRFTFDMKSAYAVNSLESLVRDFDCNEEHFTLTDTYKFSEEPTALTERFVSIKPITLDSGTVKTGGTTVVFDSDRLDAMISSVPVNSKRTDALYIVDFIPKNLCKEMSFKFKFM